MFRPLAAVVLLVLAACHDETSARASVATEGSVFERGGSGIVATAYVPYTITNRGSSTIWVPACGDDPTVAIERGVGNGWEGYSGRFCPENLSQAPIELRAGQKRSSIVPLYEAGHFRLRLVYADEASKVANVGTVSNSFDVH